MRRLLNSSIDKLKKKIIFQMKQKREEKEILIKFS